MKHISWQQLEERCANAWPSLISQLVDGWQLRFSWGVTRRANSVWPLEVGDEALLPQKLTLVEAFYHRRQITPCYKIPLVTELTWLDKTLAERGYYISAPTSVQTVALNTLLAQINKKETLPVSIDESLTEPWYQAYSAEEAKTPQQAEIRRQIMMNIGPRCGYASLQIEGQLVAVGLGVVERGWIGLFNIVTQPNYRRRGAATAVLRALAEWGQQYQAEHLYLMVMKNNKPAQALYAQYGFVPYFDYHYRILQDH